MFYNFPIISDIEQVRAAIAGREEFVEVDKGEYIVFNYLVNFADTFPPIWEDVKFPLDGWKKLANINNAILRECRGLIFDKKTGKVIARRYHKFFNYGEKPETLEFDFLQKIYVMEKLDGSMITPFKTSDGIIRIGTKMGETEIAANAKKFIDSNENYIEFIEDCIDRDLIPIFEWCSRKNRIVVDYPEDRLVLTAIRNNLTGHYEDWQASDMIARSWKIETAKCFPLNFKNARKVLEEMSDAEGFIVRFGNGHMVKLKCEWYLQLHKTLEHLQHEKDVIRLILDEKLDDAKPLLAPDIAKKIDDFGHKLFHNIMEHVEKITWDFIEAFDRTASKKQFAEYVKNDKNSTIFFKLYDYIVSTDCVYDIVKDKAHQLTLEKIKNNLSTANKVDSVRYIFNNIKWEN